MTVVANPLKTLDMSTGAVAALAGYQSEAALPARLQAPNGPHGRPLAQNARTPDRTRPRDFLLNFAISGEVGPFELMATSGFGHLSPRRSGRPIACQSPHLHRAALHNRGYSPGRRLQCPQVCLLGQSPSLLGRTMTPDSQPNSLGSSRIVNPHRHPTRFGWLFELRAFGSRLAAT